MRLLLLLVAAYLLGSLPSSYLAGRWAGVDLRERGSGNLGGTNVFRILGWKAALPVVVADVGKGFVPAWFFPVWDGRSEPWLALAFGLCAIAGHVWSAFVRFQGGKGVATSGGVLLALTPLSTLVGLLVWVGVVALTQIVSVASLSAATAIPIIAWVADAPGETVAFTTALAVFVWWTHRENVDRLLRGEELRFGEAATGGEGVPTNGPTRGEGE